MEIFNLTREEAIDAIKSRHSVREYDAAKKVEGKIADLLKLAINKSNEENPGLSLQLVLDEPRAFGGRWASYGSFKGVSSYIVVAGVKGDDMDIVCGREGEKLVLLAQHLGLNTCWVGLTYNKIKDAFVLGADDKIRCVISLGYGIDTHGRSHKRKSPEQVSNITSDSPQWFKEGIELALLAPTAVNQQKFRFDLLDDGSVNAIARFSLVGYSRIDLGIAITHFLIGANRDVKLIIS